MHVYMHVFISITTFKYKLKDLFKRSPLKYHLSNPL